MPLKSAHDKIFIEPMNDVITTVDLRMEFGALGCLMAKVMMKPMLSKDVRQGIKKSRGSHKKWAESWRKRPLGRIVN